MLSLAQKALRLKRILDSLSGGLLFALTISSLPLTAWILKPEQKVHWEMPTIIMSADGSEVIMWTGNDRAAVRKSARKKADLIVSSLFANPKDQDLVRIKTKEASDMFVEKTSAYHYFQKLSAEAIAIAEKAETSFTMVGEPYITYLPEHQLWTVETTGIFTKMTSKNDSKQMTVKIAFRRSNGPDPLNMDQSLKNRKQSSIVVSHMEVVNEGATHADATGH